MLPCRPPVPPAPLAWTHPSAARFHIHPTALEDAHLDHCIDEEQQVEWIASRDVGGRHGANDRWGHESRPRAGPLATLLSHATHEPTPTTQTGGERRTLSPFLPTKPEDVAALIELLGG